MSVFNTWFENVNQIIEEFYLWDAVQYAVAASIGIIFAFEWSNIVSASGDRAVSVSERLVVAFAATFISLLIIQIILFWFRRHKHRFDIVRCVDK